MEHCPQVLKAHLKQHTAQIHQVLNKVNIEFLSLIKKAQIKFNTYNNNNYNHISFGNYQILERKYNFGPVNLEEYYTHTYSLFWINLHSSSHNPLRLRIRSMVLS